MHGIALWPSLPALRCYCNHIIDARNGRPFKHMKLTVSPCSAPATYKGELCVCESKTLFPASMICLQDPTSPALAACKGVTQRTVTNQLCQKQSPSSGRSGEHLACRWASS